MTITGIPVETALLPRTLKQMLLHRGSFLLDADDVGDLSDCVLQLGLPPDETERFLLDQAIGEPVGAAISVEVVLDDQLFHLSSDDGLIDLVGPPASGKSELCHSIVKAILRENPGSVVAYIDCDGGFDSQRFDIGELERVHVFRVHSWTALVGSLIAVKDLMAVESHNIRACIVDSIASVLRHQLSGSKKEFELRDRLLHTITRIASDLSRKACLTVLVNQTTTDFSLGESGELKPCLGETYARCVSKAKHVTISLIPSTSHVVVHDGK